MVRRTSSDPVPVEPLLDVLDLARRAPSAGNAQGLDWVVLTTAERRREVARLAGEDDWVARGFEPWISAAPVLVVPCADHRRYRARYDEPDKTGGPDQWDVPYAWMDLGAGLQNLLLLVVEAGWVAGFLGAHALPGLAGLLGLPAGVEPAGVVPIGLPPAEPPTPTRSASRGRRDAEDVLHLEGW